MAPTERGERACGAFAEVAVERVSLGRIAADVESTRGRSDVRGGCAVLAVDLHGYYTCAESIFERVARDLDGDLRGAPSGTRSCSRA